MEKYKGNKKTNIVPLKDLNLTSRFLFDEVMEDPQTHQDALSIIFGKELPLLEKNETEKEFGYRRSCVPCAWMFFPWIWIRIFIIRKCRNSRKQI